MSAVASPSRRRLLQAAAATTCLIVFRSGAATPAADKAARLRAHVTIELDTEGTVHVTSRKVEMGQGAHGTLLLVIAEELDVPPERFRLTQSDSAPRWGQMITGGSSTALAAWIHLRRAAGQARTLLMQVAAERWAVDAATCDTDRGFVVHAPSGRRVAYGELVAAAAARPLPAPEAVRYRPRGEYRWLGKPFPQPQLRAVVEGRARYGIDQRVPGMLYATIERAPKVNGRLVRFDDSACKSVPGFIRAVALKGNRWPCLDHVRDGVAVVATHTGAALAARAKLKVEWDFSQALRTESSTLEREFRELAGKPGITFDGKPPSPEEGAFDLQIDYTWPALAHAPLEPPNATARIVGSKIEVWTGTQRQRRLHDAIVRDLGFKNDDVLVHTPLLGGGFGRRLEVEYGLETAMLARAIGKPVQVVWTREDDLRFAPCRTPALHRVQANVDAAGRITRLRHRMVAESVLAQQEPDQLRKDGADWTMFVPMGAVPYKIGRIENEQHYPKQPSLPVSWWRGTGWTTATTSVECFINDLAAKRGEDALALRLRHLPEDHVFSAKFEDKTEYTVEAKLMRRVLLAAAEKAGWQQKPPAGTRRTIACGFYDCDATYVAVVAEAIPETGRLQRVVVAVDCGTVVNPDAARAQVEGSIAFAHSAVMGRGLTLRDGEVEQRNFDAYLLERLEESPRIEVLLLPSERAVSGLGEPVVPAAIAALQGCLRV